MEEVEGGARPVPQANSVVVAEPEQDIDPELELMAEPVVQKIAQRTGDVASQVDSPDVPVRFSEKKRLHWAGKTCRLGFLLCSIYSYFILKTLLPLQRSETLYVQNREDLRELTLAIKKSAAVPSTLCIVWG